MAAPLEVIENEFAMPFPPYGHQTDAVEKALRFTRPIALAKHTVGYGKSYMAVMLGLYYSIKSDVEQIVIVCPPILIDQWAGFVRMFPDIPDILIYRGSPAQRKEMDLSSAAVVIMSTNIFIKEGKKVYKHSLTGTKFYIFDETSLIDLSTKTYRLIRQIIYRQARVYKHTPTFHPSIILNATPISKVEQAYPWITILSPGIYKTKAKFFARHVEDVDRWGTPRKYKDLGLLQRAFDLKVLDCDEDVLDLPDVTYTLIPYKLDPEHKDVYEKVKEQLFEQLPEKLTTLAIRSLFTALQTVITNPGIYGLNVVPKIYDILDGYLDQISNERVIVFTHRVKTIEGLTTHYKKKYSSKKYAMIYGKITGKAREESFELIKSKRAQVLFGSIDSIGRGLNLQFMRREIFLEIPFTSTRFRQAVGRISRAGQTRPCFVHVALAKGTVQENIYNRMLLRDEQISTILGNKDRLKEFLT